MSDRIDLDEYEGQVTPLMWLSNVTYMASNVAASVHYGLKYLDKMVDRQIAYRAAQDSFRVEAAKQIESLTNGE